MYIISIMMVTDFRGIQIRVFRLNPDPILFGKIGLGSENFRTPNDPLR